MADGFFQGGFAEGANRADRMGLAQQRQDFVEQSDLAERADRAIGDTMGIIGGIIKESQAAGATPEAMRAAVAPMVRDLSDLMTRTQRDPAPIVNRIEASLSVPQKTEPTAADTAQEEVAGLQAKAAALKQAFPNLSDEQILQSIGVTKAPSASERKAEGAAEEQQRADFSAIENARLRLDSRIDAIDKAVQQANTATTGFASKVTDTLGISELTGGTNLQETLDEVKSSLTFEELARLREAAPSGASGLGQVTRNEFAALAKARGSLEQNQELEQLVQNLQKIKLASQNIFKLTEANKNGTIDKLLDQGLNPAQILEQIGVSQTPPEPPDSEPGGQPVEIESITRVE